MSVRADLYAYLKTKSSVTTEFGAGSSMRVFPGFAPSSAALPYCTWEFISETPFHDLIAASRITDATIQFDVWAATALSALSGADGLREALDGMGRATLTSTDVQWVELLSRRDDLVPPDDSSENPIYRISNDFRIMYVSTVPTF